ncbi:MAG: type II toxin-antitoxin system RelB/DinJ family antitoxin [Ottowia sp.]|nr:type II toxin-antitoxin system RelB/DinJ family antitoxin [Ottowia sp.]MBQ9577909.1 type II toxin-antitoxin system RelB/DinJ family antitoxin [Ottowia sp.]
MNTATSTDLLLHGIPADVQRGAARAAERAGFTLSELVRQFLARVSAEGVEALDYSDEEPNEETLQAMRELEREMDDLPSYGSYEEAMQAVGLAEPHGC